MVKFTSEMVNEYAEKLLIGLTEEENKQVLDEFEDIDKNIDFRRVRNLKVYFDNNAISLTTDVKDYKQWQGGDIVVFKTHIGVVSDKRNGNGVPFVIHHYGKRQKYYEEDILEVRNDIVGHYRIS